MLVSISKSLHLYFDFQNVMWRPSTFFFSYFCNFCQKLISAYFYIDMQNFKGIRRATAELMTTVDFQMEAVHQISLLKFCYLLFLRQHAKLGEHWMIHGRFIL